MGWRRFRRRAWWDAERAHEIEHHLAIEAAENVARGMTPAAAVAAAQRKFGNPFLIREEIYHMNSVQWFDEALANLRHTLRTFRLNPGFVAVAVLSLILGIGANAAIFQLVDALRLRLLPVKDPGQLVKVEITDTSHCCTGNFSSRNSDFTFAQWEQIRDNQRAFQSVAAWGDTRFDLAERGEAQYAEGLWVSGDFFKVLGVKPLLGRLITSADDRSGCGASGVVISYPFWQRYFGGDGDVLTKSVPLDGHRLPVMGVTPPDFFGVEVGRNFDVAVPACTEPTINGEDNHLTKRHHWWLAILGRLEPGWDLKRAIAQLDAISPTVFRNTVPPNYTPESAKYYLQYKLTAESAGSGVSSLRKDYDQSLLLLLSIAGLVLLIACANLANLMLARASTREREIAVRLAIGASRGAILRQSIAESLLIATFGAMGGALISQLLSHFLVSFISSQDAPLFLNLHPDGRVLFFTAALGLLACLVFGLYPAMRNTRISPINAMKAGARGMSASREKFGVRRFLVVSQVALSLVLLVGALLFISSLRNLLTVDTGFRESGLLIVEVDMSRSNRAVGRRAEFNHELLRLVQSSPGVESAAIARIVPVSGGGWNETIRFDGQPATSKRMVPWFNLVNATFFQTMGSRLLAGRNFDQRDTPASPEVAIVNQEFVHQYLNGANPLGKTFRVVVGPGDPQHTCQIIGVVQNSKYQSLREDFKPSVFVAESQAKEGDTGINLIVRSRLPLSALLPQMKKTIATADASALLKFESFKVHVQNSILRERLMALLSGFFGSLAVILAVVGLYGVISYMVARRRNEIGIRIALGADRSTILGLVLREAGLLVGVGLLIGAALSLAATQAARSLLFGLQPSDIGTMLTAMLLLATVALLASFLPAFRASTLDPMLTLREE